MPASETEGDAACEPEAAANGAVRKRTAAPPPTMRARKYRSIAEIMREAKPAAAVIGEYYGDLRCEGVQTKIVDFFRIQRSSHGEEGEKCGSSQDGRKRRRRSLPLVRHKKRRRILPFVPSEDSKQRLEQMRSLATALTALHMEFSNDLTYMPGMAPQSANLANLEKGGMQVLCKEDKETIELCRTMYKRGECPPLKVVFDKLEGFTVEADGGIKDMTFITEYTGDVDFLKNREHDDGDSLMTLLLTTNLADSLVICPDKRGNIARFINGINNHTL
ncbi:hypothetical protein J5N97_012137 [Dioscorea zingiberensis]|uniref:Uncharacterized protein n=1 Tax=Dioscorea zingiberensis TaxID=325984 RepID=A0A9D5CN99_9LILI|nr:hypothetical protein J5N97_012137 [Dioscorea zingiberensis]